MGVISVSLPSDGSTADVADINTPITTIVNTINGGLDNSNIAAGAAIDGTKLANIQTSKLVNPYKFSYSLATSQGTGTATSTIVKFLTSNYDTSNNYSTATGQFTAPAAGWYTFLSAVDLNASSATITYLSIFKNGTEVRRSNRSTTSGDTGLFVGCDLQLAIGDTVDVRIFSSVAFTVGGLAAGNYFDGKLSSTT